MLLVGENSYQVKSPARALRLWSICLDAETYTALEELLPTHYDILELCPSPKS